MQKREMEPGSGNLILWTEYRKADSYIGRLVRDIVGLIDQKLPYTLLDLANVQEVATHSTSLDDLQVCHVRRRADGRIFFEGNRTGDGRCIYDEEKRLIHTWGRPSQVGAIDVQDKELLYTRQDNLYSFNYDTLQETMIATSLPIIGYGVMAISRTHLVMCQNYTYYLYELSTGNLINLSAQLGFPRSIYSVRLTETHLFIWLNGSGHFVSGYNLQTLRHDYSYLLPSWGDFSGNRNMLFHRELMGLPGVDGLFHIVELTTENVLRSLPLPKNSLIYCRNHRYCLVHPTTDGDQTTYHFYE